MAQYFSSLLNCHSVLAQSERTRDASPPRRHSSIVALLVLLVLFLLHRDALPINLGTTTVRAGAGGHDDGHAMQPCSGAAEAFITSGDRDCKSGGQTERARLTQSRQSPVLFSFFTHQLLNIKLRIFQRAARRNCMNGGEDRKFKTTRHRAGTCQLSRRKQPRSLRARTGRADDEAHQR